jgi:hypothetical protein
LAGSVIVATVMLALQVDPLSAPSKANAYLDLLREGDIVFQRTGGEQGRAVRLATGSPWTHVGVLFKQNGKWMVYEAVGPVQFAPLAEWIERGTDDQWTAKRWKAKDRTLTADELGRLKKAGTRFRGLPYDLQFMWSDDHIYCSELVWKMYKEGPGIELCAPRPMREHDLGTPAVQEIMRARYGSTPPLDEPMISPGALFDCPLLSTVVAR